MTPVEFCLYLQKLSAPDGNSYNMYAGNAVVDTAPAIARENLLRYLNRMRKLSPEVVLVGEAPGKEGCAVTGIPFTSEFQLVTEPFFEGGNYAVVNEDEPKKERTATAFWDILNQAGSYPLLWNIYPFHPFDPATRKNRCPNKQEIELGKAVLEKLLIIFNIKKIYGVGRKAADALREHPLFGGYVRHPSYGGVAECRRQLIEALK